MGKRTLIEFSKVLDHDSEAGEFHRLFVLSKEESTREDADKFVDGILVGEGVFVPGDTAMESDTWGLIKAGFRSW